MLGKECGCLVWSAERAAGRRPCLGSAGSACGPASSKLERRRWECALWEQQANTFEKPSMKQTKEIEERELTSPSMKSADDLLMTGTIWALSSGLRGW